MKKLLSMLLALVMLMSMMSFATAEEPLTITVMLPDFYTDVDFVVEGNPVLEAIEEATGVRLDIQWIANSSYPDQTSYTLADPDNMPMVMVLQGARDPIVVNSARQGAFWDITDMLADYPNLAGLGAGILSHADAAEGHEGALEGLVGLQTNDLLQILQILVDVAGAMRGQGRNDLGVHVQDAALSALLLLQLLQSAPQLVGSLSGASQERFVAIVGLIVVLNEIADVDFFLPDGTLKAIPLLKVHHGCSSSCDLYLQDVAQALVRHRVTVCLHVKYTRFLRR